MTILRCRGYWHYGSYPEYHGKPQAFRKAKKPAFALTYDAMCKCM
jgi:hypothetical protein